MPSSMFAPDVRRILDDLGRRIGILERRITSRVASPAAPTTIGHTHDGAGTDSVVVSDTTNPANALTEYSVAMGGNANANGSEATTAGWASGAFGARTTAFGSQAHARDADATAAGQAAEAHDTYTVAVGATANATGSGSTAVGYGANTHHTVAVAVGYTARAEQNSVAVGNAATVTSSDGTAVGSQSSAHQGATAIGHGVVTTGTFQTNLGTNRVFAGAAPSAPADALLINGQFAVWVDETADQLTFKVKYSGGTVKSGTVTLT